MNSRISALAAAGAVAALVGLSATVRAGGDKVAFPADYQKGVLYTTVDRADNKQYPAKGADGRFQKGDLIGYTVMEKRAGWGAEYPPEIRNGNWEYQAFTAAKAVNDKANLTACFQCHKPLPGNQDFVFTYDKLKADKGM